MLTRRTSTLSVVSGWWGCGGSLASPD